MNRTQSLPLPKRTIPKRNIVKWLILAGMLVATGALAAVAVASDSRILGIVAAGLPLILGATALAVTYGRNHSYR